GERAVVEGDQQLDTEAGGEIAVRAGGEMDELCGWSDEHGWSDQGPDVGGAREQGVVLERPDRHVEARPEVEDVGQGERTQGGERAGEKVAHGARPTETEPGEAAGAPPRVRSEVVGGPGIEEEVAPDTVAAHPQPGRCGGAVAAEWRMDELVGEQLGFLAHADRSGRSGHAGPGRLPLAAHAPARGAAG